MRPANANDISRYGVKFCQEDKRSDNINSVKTAGDVFAVSCNTLWTLQIHAVLIECGKSADFDKCVFRQNIIHNSINTALCGVAWAISLEQFDEEVDYTTECCGTIP